MNKNIKKDDHDDEINDSEDNNGDNVLRVYVHIYKSDNPEKLVSAIETHPKHIQYLNRYY